MDVELACLVEVEYPVGAALCAGGVPSVDEGARCSCDCNCLKSCCVQDLQSWDCIVGYVAWIGVQIVA